MNVPINEQETTVEYCRDEDRALVYSSDSTVLTRLHKLSRKNPQDWVLVKQDTAEGQVVAETYSCPKSFITFKSSKSKRTMTPEQRQAAAERLKKARRAKHEET